MQEAVLFEVNDQIGTLILNQPESRNSMTPALIEGLHDVIDNHIPSADVRAILLRGNGKGFCAGGDIGFMQEGFTGTLSEDKIDNVVISMEQTIAKLLSIPVPVVAAVHGSVAGAGISVMLSADIIIAADSTKFTTAYTKIGLNPDGGSSYLFPRAIGPRKALELFLTSELFDAQTALDMGLINNVVAEEKCLDAALALTQQLSEGPTLAFAKTKQLIQASLNNDLNAQFDLERSQVIQSFMTKDFLAGIQAFLNKETPKFSGE